MMLGLIGTAIAASCTDSSYPETEYYSGKVNEVTVYTTKSGNVNGETFESQGKRCVKTITSNDTSQKCSTNGDFVSATANLIICSDGVCKPDGICIQEVAGGAACSTTPSFENASEHVCGGSLECDESSSSTTAPTTTTATKPVSTATKPVTTKSETTKSDTTKSDTTKSDTTKSDTTKSETTKSETTKKETTKKEDRRRLAADSKNNGICAPSAASTSLAVGVISLIGSLLI